MNRILSLAVSIYKHLLQLFPESYRNKFEEDMLLDFAELTEDANGRGLRSLLGFFWCEMRDFPVNLLRAHAEENRMFKIFRSQPVSFGLRGAVGLGVVSFLAFLINDFVFWKLYSSGDSVIGFLQVAYFDLFHTVHGLELFPWIPDALGSLFTGMILGIVYAILFTDRMQYRRYILVGMFGWFLHGAVGTVLEYSTNLPFYLGTRYYVYLKLVLSLLSGAFIGLMFIGVTSEKDKIIRPLIVGSIVYPFLTYFYIRLMCRLAIIEIPWMFIALIALVTIYIGSVFIIVAKSSGYRNDTFKIIAFMTAYVMIPYLNKYVPLQWLPAINIPSMYYYDSSIHWQVMFRIAFQQGIYGIPIGLLLGFVLGSLSKKKLHLHNTSR